MRQFENVEIFHALHIFSLQQNHARRTRNTNTPVTTTARCSRSTASLRSNRLGFLGLGAGTSTFREFSKPRTEELSPLGFLAFGAVGCGGFGDMHPTFSFRRLEHNAHPGA